MASARGTEHGQNDGHQHFAAKPLSLTQEIIFIIVMSSAQGTVQGCLAQGLLPGSLIGKTFGAKSQDIAWFPAAYGLTTGTFMLIAGRAGDLWGHKPLLLTGWIWLGFWSFLAGISIYSRSMIFFDICRAFQGIGSAIIVPISLAIIGSVYKEGQRKNLAFSIYAAGAPIGFTLGAVFSALLAQSAQWTWAFYVTAIVCSLMAVLASFAVPDLKSQGQPVTNDNKNFDWLGAITSVVSLVLFNAAWNRAPVVGWQSAQAIAPLVTGLLLFILFFFIEKNTSHPLLPVNKISKNACWVLAVTALGWSSFGIHIYYLINFLTEVQHDTVLLAAAKLTPVPFSGTAAAISASLLLKKGFKTEWLLAIALVWFFVGNVLLATTPVNQTYWYNVFWAVLISPMGIDMNFPAATVMMSNMMTKENQGMAASLVATVIYYSQSIGLGIAGTVEAQVNHGNVLEGYRGALYSAVGLSGFGLSIATLYASHRWYQVRHA